MRHFSGITENIELLMGIQKDQISKLKKIDGNRFFKSKPFKLFGSEEHKYKLNGCLNESEIAKFEKVNQIELPADYRSFIKNIGNGGVGPGYGLYKLENWNLDINIEMNNFLSTNFPYTEKWNSIYAGNTDIEYYTESEEFKNWEIEYFNEKHIAGSLRISHYGCAIYYILIVSGIEKGNVWIDDRASDGGIYPLSTEKKGRYNFNDWYNEWIYESLKKLKEI